MGIFKFTKGIVTLENSNLRPLCGWVNGQRITSVFESQAYLYPGMFWIRSRCIGTAKWKAPLNWQWVRRGMEWTSKYQHLILLIAVYLECSLSGGRPCLFGRRKGEFSRATLSHVFFENVMKAMNAFQGKNGLVNKQNDHGNLQRVRIQVQSKSLCFKRKFRFAPLRLLLSLENQQYGQRHHSIPSPC